MSENNGTSGGGGSGVILATPFPGAAVYNNVVQGNTVSQNGQAGITIHSHAPAQDVNGNQILNNVVSQNTVGETNPGAGVFTSGSASAGDVDAGDPATSGIVIFSAVNHVTGTIIQGNAISNNYYGIWTQNVDTTGISGNTFANVNVPIYAVPPPGSGYVMSATDGGVSRSASSVSGARRPAKPSPAAHRLWASPRPLMPAATGSPRTLGTSPPSVTPPTSAPWPASSSTRP